MRRFGMQRCFAMAVCFGLSKPMVAAEVGDMGSAPVAVDLPDTVVVATTRASDRLETPYTVHRVREDEIRLRLQAATLPDFLAGTPGVMLQKTGHGMTAPYLRGFTSQRTVLIADGVRLNNSFLREGPNQYWNQVDPFFYDDVEVMMGPASTLYGSDAIGGVVYARSQAPLRGQAGEDLQWQAGMAAFRYASAENSFSEHLSVMGALGDRWSLRLGATRQDFGTLKTGGNVDNPKTGYEQWGANLRLAYWIDDNQKIVLGVDHFDQDNVNRVHRTVHHRDFRGTGTLGGTGDLSRYFDHDRHTAFLRYELREGEGFLEEIDAQLFYSRFSEYYVRRRSPTRADYRPTDIDTVGFRLRLQTPSDWGVWNYGFEVYGDSVDAKGWNIRDGVRTDLVQGLVADDATYLLVGAFVQNELPLHERFTLTTGLRYDHAKLDAGRVVVDDAPTSLSGNWDAVTASMRLLYRALPENRLNLFAGVSQGFRAPNLSDATREDDFGGGVESPTADLDAERFMTFELGAKHKTASTAFELSFYHTHIEDRIGRLRAPTTTKRNLDRGYIQGVELSGRWWPHETVCLFGSLAWQEGSETMYMNRDYSLWTRHYPMSRMHPLMGEIGARWQSKGGRFWLECAVDMAARQETYAHAERSDNRFPPDGTPGYGVVHLRSGVSLTDSFDLALALENVFDKAYRVHGSGVNEPGRNLIVGVRSRF